MPRRVPGALTVCQERVPQGTPSARLPQKRLPFPLDLSQQPRVRGPDSLQRCLEASTRLSVQLDVRRTTEGDTTGGASPCARVARVGCPSPLVSDGEAPFSRPDRRDRTAHPPK